MNFARDHKIFSLVFFNLTVVMAVMKHMSRIVAPANFDFEDKEEIKLSTRRAAHDHTYGITSDPLTQFAWYVLYVGGRKKLGGKGARA